MLKPTLATLILSLTALTRVVHTEESLFSNKNDTETSSKQGVPCDSGARTMRLAARHIEAGGIGYNKGYTTVEGFFAPNPSNWGYMPFLDVRGHVFNDGRLAANAGVGVRKVFGCRAYGINAYYDYRKTHRQHYNQVAVGLETMGDVWDLRINGYLPVGEKKSHPFHTRFEHFSGNSIILSQSVESAMKGADLEAGGHFRRMANWDAWIAGGPYYFIGELGGPTWGGKARFGVSFCNYLTLEFLNSWDNTFHYRPQGQITLAWPFGPKTFKKKESSCPCSLSLRMVQPVNRQEIVVVNRRRQESPAIDPATGMPYNVLFVDNTSSSAGTVESPYPSLAQAQAASSPGDIIYVFPGDGTTTNMNMGIALQPNQKFWGSGVGHPLATTLGSVSIPSQSAGLPLMTSTTGSGITLASGNDVSGFFITRPHLHGINGSNVNNVSLSNLTVFAAQNNMNGGNGINIVENNGVVNNLTLSNLDITNNAVNGIFIQTQGTSGANIFIGSNTVSVNGTSTNANNGIVLNAIGSSTMAVTLQGNSILSNLNNGIVVDSSTSGALSYLFANNAIEGNQNEAISGAFTGNSPVTVTLTGNSTIGNAGNSNSNAGTNVFSFTGVSTLTATGNQFDQSVGNGALEITAGNSLFTATIENNSMSQNCNQGFVFNANGTQLVTLVFENNDISYNCSEGLDFNSSVAANLDLTFLNNTINGNCGTGLNIKLPLNTLSFVANGNTVIGNCSTAINVCDGNIVNTSLNIIANNNTITGNCSTALLVRPSNSSTLTSFQLTGNNNLMEGNCGTGFDLRTIHADTLITLDNNTIRNNYNSTTDSGGILIISAPTGSRNLDIICNNNTILGTFVDLSSGTAPSGISFVYSGANTGTNSFTADNNTASYNGGDGILVEASGGNLSAMTLNISNNTTSFNANNGIDITTSMTSLVTFHTTLSGNTANNNDLNGINVTGGTNTAFLIHADQNTLFNNNPFGISDMLVTNTNTPSSTICLEMSGNSSNVGYSLVNNRAVAGTFNLAPSNVDTVNAGTITRTGTISSVSTCAP